MKRLLVLFFALFLISPSAFAVEDEITTNEDIDQEKTEDEEADIPLKASMNMNEPGDQFIKISLMATFPLNFGGSFPLYKKGQLSIGGAGSLGYHRFITNWWAWGIGTWQVTVYGVAKESDMT